MRTFIAKYKKIIIAMLVLVFIPVLAFGTYAALVLGFKKVGVRLKPGKSFEIPEHVKIFRQDDPKWAQECLGNSSYRLGGHGCLLAVLGTAIDYHDREVAGLDELNALFTENGVYTAGGDIIWYKIKDAFPQLDYSYNRIFGSRRMQKDLEQGLFPIIMVKYKGSGIHHWVLVVGANDDDFLVVDPLSDKIIPLSEHGSRAYAYRVLVPRDGLP